LLGNQKRVLLPTGYLWYSTAAREKLVILGSGWAGFTLLSALDKSKYDVTLVTPRNHFLFTPLLPSTAVGTVEFQSIIEPVHSVGKIPHNTIIAKAVDVLLPEKKVKLSSGHSKHILGKKLEYEITYDKLIISVGALHNTFNVPGVVENAFFLKEISHSRAIHERILTNFELALEPAVNREEMERLLHIVIVGGGPTGIEFGAELYDFVSQDVPRYYKGEEDLIQVSIIEGGKVLGLFDESLRKEAERVIGKRKRFRIVKNTVTEVCSDHVKLADGTNIPCGLVVWSAGISQHPFIQKLDYPKDKHGRILVNQFLQLEKDGTRSVYAMGDCANGTVFTWACTAQVAERQGLYLAKALNNLARGRQVDKFTFKSMGMLAYIGERRGLSDLPEYKLKGYSSWLLWRTLYLWRLKSWSMVLRVAADWARTEVFGRNITSW